MTSTETTTPRYTAERIDGDWTVIKTDETGRQGIGTYPSRDEARHAAKQARLNAAELRAAEVTSRDWEADPEVVQEVAEEAAAQDDEDEQAVAELTEQIAQDEGLAARVADDPDAGVAVEPSPYVEDDPEHQASREDDDEVLVPSAEEEAARVILDQPADVPVADAVAKVQRTGESVLARKMEPGQRIKLRGVGVVEVVSAAKIKGQQKMTVTYKAEDGAETSTELWINSRYSIVA